jgi:hypothetical protein
MALFKVVVEAYVASREWSGRVAGTRGNHKLELSGLLRGGPAQRWQAWKIARETDILTADEIREEEGFNPRGA